MSTHIYKRRAKISLVQNLRATGAIKHKKWMSMSFYSKFISNYVVEFTKCILFVIIPGQCILFKLSVRIKKLGTWELIRACGSVEMKNWSTFIQKLLTFGLQITSSFSVKSFSTADFDLHWYFQAVNGANMHTLLNTWCSLTYLSIIRSVHIS